MHQLRIISDILKIEVSDWKQKTEEKDILQAQLDL